MSSENAHKTIFLKIETTQMLRRAAVRAKHRNGMNWVPSGRSAGKVTRGLNYMAIIDEVHDMPTKTDLWVIISSHIDRSVYFRPVWAGTKIPVEMVSIHNSSFDTGLLERQMAQQSEWYYDTMAVGTGRQHGRDFTLKTMADKMMTDEYYESIRYKTIFPPRLYDQIEEMFGEDYVSGAIRGSSIPWNSREEKKEYFRRAYGLPDNPIMYGDTIEGLTTGRFASSGRKD